MSDDDHYRVLGCDKESCYQDLKKAYRKLILVHHPDKNASDRTTVGDDFRRIEEAWKILRDPDSKRKYDAQRRQSKLESESILVYAKISRDQMEAVDDDMLSYLCRCGGYYLVNKDDLLEKNVTLHVPCRECTFVLMVETP